MSIRNRSILLSLCGVLALATLSGCGSVGVQPWERATLAEYSYGQGWVVLSTLTYGWGDAGAKGAPLNNMLYYAANQIRGSEAASVATPEPASMLLTAGGLLLGCTFLRRRR